MATLGVGLSVSCRMAFLGSSSLHSERVAVGELVFALFKLSCRRRSDRRRDTQRRVADVTPYGPLKHGDGVREHKLSSTKLRHDRKAQVICANLRCLLQNTLHLQFNLTTAREQNNSVL